MNAFWILTAIVTVMAVLVVVAMVFRSGRFARGQTSPLGRSMWLVAACVSGTILMSIGARVNDLIPNATVVDVAALAVTGVLTGFFLAIGLWPSDSQPAKR